MPIQLNLKQAKAKLYSAYQNRKQLIGSIAINITDILRGPNKTYRYILFTELLAKATDERIDVYSLQANDGSDGAYDARTLCHKVVVKFEKKELPFGLGGSNEPFVNNPARVPRLSSENVVRKGKDSIIHGKLLTVLGAITDEYTAYEYLRHAVFIMKQIHDEYEAKYDINPNVFKKEYAQNILDFTSDLVEKSCEGEICPIVVSAIESLFLGDSYKINPHKVNESGASSNEIGDIDIINNLDEIVFAIEVKDKEFTREDVEHAIRKFYDAKIKRSYFIYGKRILPKDLVDIHQLLGRFGRIGYYCCLINIIDYSKLRLSSIPDLELSKYIELLLQYAKTINATDETIEWIKNTAKLHI